MARATGLVTTKSLRNIRAARRRVLSGTGFTPGAVGAAGAGTSSWPIHWPRQSSGWSSPRLHAARGLHLEDLTRLPVCLAVAPGHPLARRKTVKIAEIARHPLVAFSSKEYPDYHEVLAAWFSKAKEKPRIAEEHDSVASLIAAVEAGDGVALVTESMACVAGSRLSLTRIVPAPSPLLISAVWPEGKLSATAEHFLSCARKCAKAKSRIGA